LFLSKKPSPPPKNNNNNNNNNNNRKLAGRVVEGNILSSRALARILPAFLFQRAPWHAARTPAESAPAAAAALAAAAGAPAAAAALLPPPPPGAPAGTRQLVAAASAFGNCVSLPLVVLGALLPMTGVVAGGSNPYETAAAYVSLYALGWSPMLWTLGGRKSSGLFFSFFERDRGREGKEAEEKNSSFSLTSFFLLLLLSFFFSFFLSSSSKKTQRKQLT